MRIKIEPLTAAILCAGVSLFYSQIDDLTRRFVPHSLLVDMMNQSVMQFGLGIVVYGMAFIASTLLLDSLFGTRLVLTKEFEAHIEERRVLYVRARHKE